MKLLPASSSDQEFFELLELARQGDLDALGQMIERCRPYLLKIAHEEGGADLQAKFGASDLVQTTCLDAVRVFKGFRGQTSQDMLGWLRQMMIYRLRGLRDRYQAGKRAAKIEVPLPLDGDPTADLETSSASPCEQIVRQEEREVMEQALRTLSAEERLLIEMRQKDGLAFADIARQLQVTEAAARKRWVRAIRTLQEKVGSRYGRSFD